MCLRVQQRVAGVGRSGGGEPTLSERGGSLENWLRPGGAGMGFALKYWPAMGQERERGRPWPGAHPGTEPQSAQFLGRLEPISILQHKRLSFIS